MKNLRQRSFTPDESPLLENRAEFKSQYVAGGIFAADGEEPEHIQIVGNIVFALEVELTLARIYRRVVFPA